MGNFVFEGDSHVGVVPDARLAALERENIQR
jgi:hypothetical protein